MLILAAAGALAAALSWWVAGNEPHTQTLYEVSPHIPATMVGRSALSHGSAPTGEPSPRGMPAPTLVEGQKFIIDHPVAFSLSEHADHPRTLLPGTELIIVAIGDLRLENGRQAHDVQVRLADGAIGWVAERALRTSP
jgi:hypothetical protein